MCVVAQQDESSMRSILLNNPPQRHLCRTSQRVRLIQNTQLILRDILLSSIHRARREDLPRAREGFDLVAHYIDTSVIGGIEL